MPHIRRAVPIALAAIALFAFVLGIYIIDHYATRRLAGEYPALYISEDGELSPATLRFDIEYRHALERYEFGGHSYSTSGGAMSGSIRVTSPDGETTTLDLARECGILCRLESDDLHPTRLTGDLELAERINGEILDSLDFDYQILTNENFEFFVLSRRDEGFRPTCVAVSPDIDARYLQAIPSTLLHQRDIDSALYGRIRNFFG